MALTSSALAVGLNDLLAARERRAERQATLLERHAVPLVCLTIVVPGPIKGSAWARRALLEGMGRFCQLCAHNGWVVVAHEHHWPASGPEAFYAVAADAASVKGATIELEDAEPIGHLWDFNVIEPGTIILSRQTFGLHRGAALSATARRASAAGRDGIRWTLLLTAIGTIIDQHDAGAPG